MMKKMLSALLSMMLILTGVSALASDDGSAYDAFATISIGVANASSLDEVMSGAFATVPATTEDAQVMADWLDQLIAVTTKDMSIYAAENSLSETAVRNAYYTALTNVLDAQLMLNPESEAHYQDVKALLTLQAQTDDAQQHNTSQKNNNTKTNRNTNTPDRNTNNTPDRNTRNTPNTPDRNTRNTPNTPDRNTRNTPDRNT